MYTRLTPRGRVLRLLLFKSLVIVTASVTVARGAVTAGRTLASWFRASPARRAPVMAATRQPIPLIPNPIQLPPQRIETPKPFVPNSSRTSIVPAPVHSFEPIPAPIDPRFPLPIDPNLQQSSNENASPSSAAYRGSSSKRESPQHETKTPHDGSPNKKTNTPPPHKTGPHGWSTHSGGSAQKSGKK